MSQKLVERTAKKCLDFVLGCPMNQTELNEKVPGVTILQGSLNYLF